MLSNDRSIKLTFHSFYIFKLFFIYRTTVKPIQVIIISSIIYSSSIVLLSFIFLDLTSTSSYPFKPCFVDFWLVCIIFIRLEFIDPEKFPRCYYKLSVGCIQIRHTDLLPPQACAMSLWGCLFLWLHLLPSMHLLNSRGFPKLFKFKFV